MRRQITNYEGSIILYAPCSLNKEVWMYEIAKCPCQQLYSKTLLSRVKYDTVSKVRTVLVVVKDFADQKFVKVKWDQNHNSYFYRSNWTIIEKLCNL